MHTTTDYFRAALGFAWRAEPRKFPKQSLLADYVGASQGFISELLRGVKEPSPELQARVARAFEYDVIAFLALGQSLLEGVAPRHPPNLAPVAPAPGLATISLPAHDKSPLRPRERDTLERALMVLRSPGVRGSPDKLLQGALKAACELVEVEGGSKPVAAAAEGPNPISAAG